MSTEDKVRIHLVVNGKDREAEVEPRHSLADALRGEFGLTGTHIGCEHGVCGTCTVLLDGAPVRSCLTFAVQADGRQVRTVEDLADDAGLSDLQAAFSRHRALQCGYCTPGFLMLAEGFLATEPEPDWEQVRDVMSSNLCRCTGYQGIIDAVTEVASARHGARAKQTS